MLDIIALLSASVTAPNLHAPIATAYVLSEVRTDDRFG